MFTNDKDFFEKFTKKYNIQKEPTEVETFAYKYYHTYRVVKRMEEILAKLNLTEREEEIAKTLAIFHDLGRFVQLEKTKHYDDIKTKFDHAKESVNILKDANWFQENKVDKKTEDQICFAIDSHNKYEIPKCKDQEKVFFAKLIRDADKLVIMEEGFSTEKSKEITKEVWNDFENERLVNLIHVHTKIDTVFSLVAFIFDLNFDASITLLEELEILKPYLTYLKENTDENTYQKIEQIINNYLQKRKKENIC